MRETNAIRALQAFRDQYPTQQAAAHALGVAPSYFGDLLRGRRSCSERLLARLGLKRIIVPTKAAR
jgi:hypothetical protein